MDMSTHTKKKQRHLSPGGEGGVPQRGNQRVDHDHEDIGLPSVEAEVLRQFADNWDLAPGFNIQDFDDVYKQENWVYGTASWQEGVAVEPLHEEKVILFGEDPSLEDVVALFPPHFRPKPIPLEVEKIKSLSDMDLLRLVPSLTPPASLKVLTAKPAEACFPADIGEDLKTSLCPEVFKAGSVSDRADNWARLLNLEKDSWVYKQVKGIGFSVLNKNVFFMQSQFKKRNPQFCYSAENKKYISEEVKALAEKGCIFKLARGQAKDVHYASCILPLLVAENALKKKRLCWNGVWINQFIAKQKFKFETISHAVGLAKPGDFMFTIDLKGGYHQFRLQPDLRRFCCFEWEGDVFQWQVLPFGLNIAPWAFTKIVRVVLERWREKGIRCSN